MNRVGKPGKIRAPVIMGGIGAVLAGAVAGYLMFFPRHSAPELMQAPAWAGRGTMAVMDHHTHTRSSDGGLNEKDLVELAFRAGCDVLAITDHSDTLGTVGEAQFKAIEGLRQDWPELVLFAGLEVNMPSYNGREHVTILIDPAHERLVLPALKAIAEQDNTGEEIKDETRAGDDRLLRRVAQLAEDGANLLLIYNHPSRKDEEARENRDDLLAWQGTAPYFIGFEGAPGHQNTAVTGSYDRTFKTIDRWDPAVGEIGGLWDRLLSQGYQYWGAIAGSDYHNDRLDHVPCGFSRTHLEVPLLSYNGVLDALRAGSFWADHGRILDRLVFTAKIQGLEAPLHPGSIARLGGDMPRIALELAVTRGEGATGAPLIAELIGNCRTGQPELLAAHALGADADRLVWAFKAEKAGADGDSCYVRLRLRRQQAGEPDLLAYSNPIRFYLR